MQIYHLNDTQLLSLITTPELFPIGIDIENDRIFFCKMSLNDYVREPFHDQRLLHKNSILCGCTISGLLKRFSSELANPKPQRFIFHSAFCGSTLLSRYLDDLQESFVYREPQVFMELADFKHQYSDCYDEAHWTSVQSLLVVLLSRTYGNTYPIIKQVDNCNGIITGLLSLNPESLSLGLYSSLNEFLLSCLKSPERRNFAQQRLSRMDVSGTKALSRINIASLSEPETIACLWLLQMYQLLEACEKSPRQFKTLSRETLFSQPKPSLIEVLDFYHFDHSDELLQNIINKYSIVHAKSGKAFSLTSDNDNNAKLREEHQIEIELARSWAEKITNLYPIPDRLPNSLL